MPEATLECVYRDAVLAISIGKGASIIQSTFERRAAGYTQ